MSHTLGPPPNKQAFTEDDGHPAAWEQWFSDVQRLLSTSQATGTTAQRPVNAPFVGFPYFDTTLGKPVWAKTVTPTTWVDATGAPT